MNEHAGLASALSALIVAVFAVLLHDRTPASPQPTRPAIASKVELAESIEPPQRIASAPLPAQPAKTIPVVPPVSSQPQPGTTIARSPVARPVESVVRPSVEARPTPTNPPEPSKPPEITPKPGPKAPFTVVQAGEKLADVARRVYGSATAARSLWEANRDQVALIDSPLPNGILLRTP